jgi:hypothetical protein
MDETRRRRHRGPAPGAADPAPGGAAPPVPGEERGHEREVVHDAREKVEEVTRETGHELRRAVETRKDHAAETLERVARAMRRTADSLEVEDAEQLADYPERAAERVDRLSTYLRRHDLGEVLADAEGFARRRPELFFGGLAVAGMAAGRFLRSSSPSRERSSRPSGTHSPGGTPGPAYGTATPPETPGTTRPERPNDPSEHGRPV